MRERPGIGQTQVDGKIDLTLTKALRPILHHMGCWVHCPRYFLEALPEGRRGRRGAVYGPLTAWQPIAGQQLPDPG